MLRLNGMPGNVHHGLLEYKWNQRFRDARRSMQAVHDSPLISPFFFFNNNSRETFIEEEVTKN